jgi:hypothetical protein
MKIYLTAISILVCCMIHAQKKSNTVLAETGGAISLQSFTQDSLVPPRRKGKIAAADDLHASVQYLFSLPGTQLKLRAGIGYAERHFSLNKTSFGDMFTAIFGFGAVRQDTFHLSQVRMTNKYINIPVGFSYRLAHGRPKRVEVHAGVQVNNLFLISSQASGRFDSAYHIPTPAEKTRVENEYGHTATKYVSSLYPRIDLRIAVIRQLGINLTLQPLMVYFNSTNKRILQNSTSFAGFAGLYYDL